MLQLSQDNRRKHIIENYRDNIKKQQHEMIPSEFELDIENGQSFELSDKNSFVFSDEFLNHYHTENLKYFGYKYGMKMSDYEAILDLFFEQLDVAEQSLVTYRSNMNGYIRYLIEQGIERPSKKDILRYKEHLELSEKKNTTRRGYLVVVKMFYKYLEKRHIYPDIASEIKLPDIDKTHKKDNLTKDQVLKLLENPDLSTLNGRRDYAIILLMVTTGLRDIEVSRATIESIKPKGNEMVLYIHGKGKEGADLYVKLTKHTYEAITQYHDLLREDELYTINEKSHLFLNHSNRDRGNGLTTRSIRRIVKNHLKAIGLDSSRLTAHSLRHTAATLNLVSGGSVRETQQLLRHESITTTMIYTHDLDRENNMSEHRIEDFIFGESNENLYENELKDMDWLE